MPADIETLKRLYRDQQYAELRTVIEHSLRESPGDVELLCWAARCALALKMPEAAADYATRALEVDPSRRDAGQYLAKAQVSLENWEGARQTAETVLSADPGNTAFQVIAGRAKCSLGEYAEALHHFRMALAGQPDDPQILKLAGNAAFQSGDFDFALKVFSVLAEKDSAAALSAVQELREKQQTETAAYLLKQIILHHPDDDKVKHRATALSRELVLRANMAQQAGNEQEAARFHATVLQFEPDSRHSKRFLQKHSREIRNRVRQALQSGDSSQALALLEGLANLTPNNAQLRYEIAKLKEKTDDPGAAEAWVAAANTGPHDSARVLKIAERLNSHGKVADAALLFLKLQADIALDQNAQRIRNKIIVGLQHSLTRAARAGEIEELQKLLAALTQIDPENQAIAKFTPKAITIRARELREARLSGDVAKVEHHAKALLELDPANIPAMRYLTNSYTRRGKWRDALPVARKLAKHLSSDRQTLRNLARICYSAKAREEGIAACDQCLADDPDDSQLLSLREKLAALPSATAAA